MALSCYALSKLREFRESICISSLSLAFNVFAFFLENVTQKMVTPVYQRFLVFICCNRSNNLFVAMFEILCMDIISMLEEARAVLVDNLELHVLNFLQ